MLNNKDSSLSPSLTHFFFIQYKNKRYAADSIDIKLSYQINKDFGKNALSAKIHSTPINFSLFYLPPKKKKFKRKLFSLSMPSEK